MGGKPIYRKLFYIFNQEDPGFGAGQSPSGYVKIEARDGKGKLSATVQNLKEDPKSLLYKLYIMKCTENNLVPVLAGTVPVIKNKGELQWEFSAENIAGLNITIDDINTAAILAENTNKTNYGIVCPLAAYKDKKTQWREKLKSKLYQENQNKSIPSDNAVQSNNPYTETENNAINVNKPYEHNPMPDVNVQEKPEIQNEIMPEQYQENLSAGNTESSYEEYKDMVEKVGHHYTLKNNEINMPCGNIGCGLITEDSGVNPCANCFMKKAQTENAETGIQGDVERLRKDLDRCFEICDPFRSRRRDYKWWKVNSPVHLNNVLFQCNIKTPVLFNPKILMAHFKYRHLIFGIYSDTVRQKEYVVFGVPGVYSVDDRPFKDICRWAQVEGNKPRYGAFGYWLVYIDPKTGKIV